VDLHIDDLVADALAVLDAAEVTQPVIVIGIELGAVIAERLQNQHPARVAGHVLVNYPSAAMLDAETLTDIATRAYREQAEQALNMWLNLSWGEGWQGTAPRNRIAAARRSAQAIHPVLTALAAASLEPVPSLDVPGGDPFASEEAVNRVIRELEPMLTRR
jgi:pimeloyl-ACP methyl ester carboxylesterase